MSPRPGRAGFTLIELMVVMLVSGMMLSFAGWTVNQYFGRTAARRAAQVFAQDLTQARMFAVRSQEPVVLRFYEGGLRYEIATLETGTEIAHRRFSSSDGIDLSAIALDLDGDSLVFDRRGFADLVGSGAALGVASFASGAASYRVSFNSLGASRIEDS